MVQLTQIIQQIQELNPADREELLARLNRETNGTPGEFPSIVHTPDVCGGAACFTGTRIPVWAVERMRQLEFSDVDILRSYPALRATDLVRAWAYANAHRTEIETAIRENEQD